MAKKEILAADRTWETSFISGDIVPPTTYMRQAIANRIFWIEMCFGSWNRPCLLLLQLIRKWTFYNFILKHIQQKRMKVYKFILCENSFNFGHITVWISRPWNAWPQQTKGSQNKKEQKPKLSLYLNKEFVFIFLAISSFFSCASVIQLGSFFFSAWVLLAWKAYSWIWTFWK